MASHSTAFSTHRPSARPAQDRQHPLGPLQRVSHPSEVAHVMMMTKWHVLSILAFLCAQPAKIHFNPFQPIHHRHSLRNFCIHLHQWLNPTPKYYLKVAVRNTSSPFPTGDKVFENRMDFVRWATNVVDQWRPQRIR